MQIQNFLSNSGNAVANQFELYDNDGSVWFQSYSTVIAVKRNNGSVELDERAWDYSRTTGKYRNKFLGEGIAETRAKIASGEYQLSDLN